MSEGPDPVGSLTFECIASAWGGQAPPSGAASAPLRPAGWTDEPKVDPGSGAPATVRRSGDRQIALAQALHLLASSALSVLQKGQVLTGAASSSLMNSRESHQATKAMTMKAMIALMNAP